MKWSMKNKDINFCKNIRILKKSIICSILANHYIKEYLELGIDI
jgi:hypothetical protein